MNKNEKLALVYAAFDTQLKSARRVLDERFKAPLGVWVDRLVSRCRTVDNKIKIFRPQVAEIPESRAFNVALVNEDLKDAVERGQISHAKMIEWVRSGKLLLTLPPEESLLELRALRRERANSAYTVTLPAQPATWRPELRVLALHHGVLEGLANQIRPIVDIEGRIREVADRIRSGLDLESRRGRRTRRTRHACRTCGPDERSGPGASGKHRVNIG